MEQEEVGYFEAVATEQGVGERNDMLIPGLPNAIATLCIARVPRLYHGNLKGVSLIWRNLLCGRVFLEVRRELSLVEEWFYVWTKTRNGGGSDVWHCFNPSLNRWLKLPTMPNDHRVSGHSTVASVDGKIFIIGGSFSRHHTFCKTVSCFDTRSYKWQKVADLNIARAQCTAGIIKNQLYVFGGYSGPSEMLTTIEVYNLITDTWTVISSMEFPLIIHDSVVMGDKFYVTNLRRADSFLTSGRKGVVYDGTTDQWENMPKGLNCGWTTSAVVLNGKLYTVDLVTPVEPKHIQVYNWSKDDWDTVSGVWDDAPNGVLWNPKLFMADVVYASLAGKLCILAVDTDDIILRILDITESVGHHSYSITYKDEITEKIDLAGRRWRPTIKCQVVGV